MIYGKGYYMQRTPQHFDTKMFFIIDKVSYLAIIVHIFLIGIFFWLGYLLLSFLNIFFTMAWIYGRRVNINGNQSLSALILTTEVILHNIVAVSMLGWESGFQYYLLTALIFNVFRNDLKKLETIGIAFILIGSFIMLHVYTSSQIYVHKEVWLFEMMYYNNVIMALGVMSLIAYYFKEATIDHESKIEILANTDHLTGLQTRRSMQKDIDGDIKRSLINGKESIIILADIDHFKLINDTYGHDYGDKVLREIAQRLKENLRYGDKIYRWGGEEFLIILNDTSISAAKNVAQSLRNDVSTAVFAFEDHEFNVNMTFGMARLKSIASSIEDAINEADKALYHGKENGRNCVIFTQNNTYEQVDTAQRNVLSSYAQFTEAI